MADHIPFITGEDRLSLFAKTYADSDVIRISLDRADKVRNLLPTKAKVWLDPCVDGMHDLESRRVIRDRNRGTERKNPWFGFMEQFPGFEKIASPAYYVRPDPGEVEDFVAAVLEKCASFKPAWLTVPQMPLVEGSARNKINHLMASAAGTWNGSRTSPLHLILPLVFTHQDQLNGKTARNPKVRQAEQCYREARADGFWVVDVTLTDDSGSPTLRNKRFPGILALHKELNERIPSTIRVAGPYWGLNLVLWSRGLVDYPAVGIGSGYQYFLAGGRVKSAAARLALPSLRRRVGHGPELRAWLDAACAKTGPGHPAYLELSQIRRQYAALAAPDHAREQVAGFYKQWFDVIAAAPKAGRPIALFQDLSAAYALGKSLPPLGAGEGTARRPYAVAEPLMLSCL